MREEQIIESVIMWGIKGVVHLCMGRKWGVCGSFCLFFDERTLFKGED